MDTLFSMDEEEREEQNIPTAPLADRARPASLDEVIGQEHLLGEQGPLRSFFATGIFPSIILWGPPGVGKTTLALLMAQRAEYHFTRISAIEAGVKEVREIITQAKRLRRQGQRVLLFIDEIHRFNKSQQDALLHAVETGIITLIGATTENPSFEVNAALLSRCRVYRLQSLTDEHIRAILEQALHNDPVLKTLDIKVRDWDVLLTMAGGDARAGLTALELAISVAAGAPDEPIVITRDILERALQQKTAQYDKHGESHYDTISAFIKSMRGSDPDAALLWLAKMIDAGEEPRFIARRMVIFASEDIGNADPFALPLAVAVFQAVEMIGLPEARINLAQGVTYLASCPKSNASYMGIDAALGELRKRSGVAVPLHLRNAPTKLMKEEGYGTEYKYPHDYEQHFVREHYFPETMRPKKFYDPGNFGREKSFQERLRIMWPDRYDSQDENREQE